TYRKSADPRQYGLVADSPKSGLLLLEEKDALVPVPYDAPHYLIRDSVITGNNLEHTDISCLYDLNKNEIHEDSGGQQIKFIPSHLYPQYDHLYEESNAFRARKQGGHP